jgi:hypothetical protein
MSKDLRIGDAERDAAVAALGEHFAAGRLDAQEYEDRSSAAWAARSAGALVPLFEDLPAPHARTTSSSPAPASGAAARRPAWSPRVPPVPLVILLVVLAVMIGPGFVAAVLACVWFFRTRHQGGHHGGPWHPGHRGQITSRTG